MADRDRFRNLLNQLADMDDDQLVRLDEGVQAQLQARDLSREKLAREEERERLGIFLNLDPSYELTYYRLTGRTARPKQGFAPLTFRQSPEQPWHAAKAESASGGLSFSAGSLRVQSACGIRSVTLADNIEAPLEWSRNPPTCQRCFGCGEIAVGVSDARSEA